MNWKKVQSNVWRPEAVDESIEGILIKKEPSTEYDNNEYEIDVVESNGVIRRKVYGTTVLDDRMKDVKVGQAVKIIYKGEKKVKKGMSKMFEVYVNADNQLN